MNQLQYAQTVAAAYMRQYGPDSSPVMGTPVIIYRSLYDVFDWQSNVHELEPDEVFVTTVEEEMYGDVTATSADAIVDLVSTGTTLRANHLEVIDEVLSSQAGLYRCPQPLAAEAERLIQTLLTRIEGVQQAQEAKYVMMHAPKAKLSEITALLPGAETPTVLSLEGNDERVALHAMCTEQVFWEHLEELKKAGASAILVLPVEKMLA